ncbi:MAG: M1 family metallopeptidase [Myxococcales bacterium]|nr:M1 family metallopeptidase [Myxococcales bacterium]
MTTAHLEEAAEAVAGVPLDDFFETYVDKAQSP